MYLYVYAFLCRDRDIFSAQRYVYCGRLSVIGCVNDDHGSCFGGNNKIDLKLKYILCSFNRTCDLHCVVPPAGKEEEVHGCKKLVSNVAYFSFEDTNI